MKTRFLVAALFLLPGPAAAYEFLAGYDTAPDVGAALERAKAEPGRHVLLYFGMSEFCPPCRQARAVLNSDAVRAKWRPNYVVVNIDLFAPTAQEREVIDQVRVSWAPVLVFLDASGKRVAYARQLQSEKEALALNELVSQRRYALSAFEKYAAQDFAPGRIGGAALAAGRIDDRPRLRDVTAQRHVRLGRADLLRLLQGKRMRKENQDWFLTLEFREKNLLEAEGQRKHGRGEMRGAGKWYVTRKGKLCLELSTRGVDENWCRHVFFAGDTYYLSKDLRPSRLVYRLVPERG
ncbi:MAG: thioredoxin fold domain-containing protein [Pseudomonadota bacterium]